MKIWLKIDHMLNTFITSQNLAKPNDFEDICEKTTVWPLCPILVTAAMLLNCLKIPTYPLCRIPQGTFMPSLVPISQVVSEGKRFKKLITTTTDAKWWQDSRRSKISLLNFYTSFKNITYGTQFQIFDSFCERNFKFSIVFANPISNCR